MRPSLENARLLGLCGSLRALSLNRAALEAAVVLAQPGIELTIYRELRDLPLYDNDLDNDAPPGPVRQLRQSVSAADGLIIATPEFAHGIAGPMKNALDWLVRDANFVGKRIALWNTSLRARHAQAQLREVLATMSAQVVEEASLALPLLGSAWMPETIAGDADFALKISASLDVLASGSRAIEVTDPALS